MSTIQTAAANAMFGIVDQFRQNCSLKHGLPKMPVLERVGDEPMSTSEDVTISRTETTETTVKESPSPGDGAAAVAQGSPWVRAAPLLLTAAVAGGIPSYLLWNKQTPATAQPAPVVQPTQETKDGDLLQWLQSQGKHLPEGTWQTK